MFQLEEKTKSKILDFKIFKKQHECILESVFFLVLSLKSVQCSVQGLLEEIKQNNKINKYR